MPIMDRDTFSDTVSLSQESFSSMDTDSNVICYDLTEEEIMHLIRRNHVLLSLCGLAEYPYVTKAVIRIQAMMRGFILRKDKQEFERATTIFLSNCRMFLKKVQFRRARSAALYMQSYQRGRLVRKSSMGRAVSKVLQSKQHILELELLVLRLCSIKDANFLKRVENNQIDR